MYCSLTGRGSEKLGSPSKDSGAPSLLSPDNGASILTRMRLRVGHVSLHSLGWFMPWKDTRDAQSRTWAMAVRLRAWISLREN